MSLKVYAAAFGAVSGHHDVTENFQKLVVDGAISTTPKDALTGFDVNRMSFSLMVVYRYGCGPIHTDLFKWDEKIELPSETHKLEHEENKGSGEEDGEVPLGAKEVVCGDGSMIVVFGATLCSTIITDKVCNLLAESNTLDINELEKKMGLKGTYGRFGLVYAPAPGLSPRIVFFRTNETIRIDRYGTKERGLLGLMENLCGYPVYQENPDGCIEIVAAHINADGTLIDKTEMVKSLAETEDSLDLAEWKQSERCVIRCVYRYGEGPLVCVAARNQRLLEKQLTFEHYKQICDKNHPEKKKRQRVKNIEVIGAHYADRDVSQKVREDIKKEVELESSNEAYTDPYPYLYKSLTVYFQVQSVPGVHFTSVREHSRKVDELFDAARVLDRMLGKLAALPNLVQEVKDSIKDGESDDVILGKLRDIVSFAMERREWILKESKELAQIFKESRVEELSALLFKDEDDEKKE